MDLILWRHADAEPGEPDMERPLTSKGAKQAARMAAWLDHRLPEACRIIVSPAWRTQQTALALKRKFKTRSEVAPDVAPESIFAAANWPDSRETVLVVGHQPTLGRVAAMLLSGEDHAWSVSKGAVWWFSNRERSRGPQVALRVVMTPDFV